ncbi:MAG TPA: succinyldiaminopimelate transaminase [Gammaproteobacteria bacterium]|nr:succinyldiaminopimelate transaminase [Gammaproteobacteria bacterium]
MNPDLKTLQPYPFQRINELKKGITPPADKSLVSLAIGEPKHPTPDIILNAMRDNLSGLAHYPLTKGSTELRQAIANWLIHRFKLPQNSLDIETQILPVNGTREALFAFAQAVVDRSKKAKVLMPNPFYQIYEGATLLAGAEPVYLPCTADNHFNPDFDAVDEATWNDCQLIYLCSPSNPTGAVISTKAMKQLLNLAEKHDFIIASDECYSEIYLDEDNPPIGLLDIATQMGNTDYKRCVVFHSLSKRSNAPGLRSGFIAGDAKILTQFLLYRTYHGCAMSPSTQIASIAAWNDEQHVIDNRTQYRQKFTAVLDILSPIMDVKKPDASFYLWAGTKINDELFTREIYAQQHLNIIPGSYLSREVNGINPGENRIRLALVATLEECIQGANRIKEFIN